MVRIVLDIQDMPQHQRGRLLRLCRQQFLAAAEAMPVGHPLHQVVAEAIARLELRVAEKRRRQHRRTGAVGIGSTVIGRPCACAFAISATQRSMSVLLEELKWQMCICAPVAPA